MPTNDLDNAPKVPQSTAPEAPKGRQKRGDKNASQSGETASVPTSVAPPASVLPQAVAAALSSESQPAERADLGVRHMADTLPTGEVVQKPETARAANQKGKPVTAATPRDANGAAKPKQKGYRGRRKIRTEEQLERRYDWIQRALERGELDVKAAAVMVQSLNGLGTVMRYRKDLEFDKRLAAIEGRLGPVQRKRADA